MTKPKNRQAVAVFSRKTRGSQEQAKEQENVGEIPRSALREIRALIEEDKLTSTTKIADKLNEGGLSCASADSWTANLVDSALRRQDMEGLRDTMVANRGDADPDGSDGPSRLEITQAAYDGAKAAVKEAQATTAPDVTAQTIRDLREQIGKANTEVAATVAAQVKETVTGLLDTTDLSSLKRVTEQTGTNVGTILTRIDDTCADLHDTVVSTLGEHGTKVVDTVEGLMHEIYARIDDRFDTLESNVVEKFSIGVDVDMNELLGRIVDERLKSHLDAVVNQFAAMVEGMKRDLRQGRR